MKFPLYIAKRYLLSKSNNSTINIITVIAALGVVFGSLALFIVLSGFSGLRTFSLNFIKTSDPDLKITTTKGKTFLFTDTLQRTLTSTKGVADYTLVLEERAFLNYKNKDFLASIKGVDSNYLNVNKIDTAVYVGSWLNPDFENTAIIGNGISQTLSLGVLDFTDPLKIYVPKPGKGYVSNPKNAINKIYVQPVGIYSLTEDYDKKFVFIDLPMAQELLQYGDNQISGIEIATAKDYTTSAVKDDLELLLGDSFKIQTREQLNAVYYKMLNTEHLVLYLIFTLILIIALFNVIGAIIMMILDKKENIKTLYNIGATLTDIKKIFVLHGFLLSLFGLLIGLSLGVILVLLQQQFGIFMITTNLAYPVEFTFLNVFVVIATILILGYIASKIASSRISKKLIE